MGDASRAKKIILMVRSAADRPRVSNHEAGARGATVAAIAQRKRKKMFLDRAAIAAIGEMG